ncbi:hypothetical protein LOTGIDRAFT_233447 [Lottia gigantea]|uniref:Ammonium transporter AmtB-like domain-containing protein n=1 Tax=Lottia gigantea TaxID=225164 RepID=V4A9D7_LOTGI|nr:hypothetical protein LOTGIDRAFT_233447 [Lottia gigantea]ESO91695.1 hypothetical protein LOTGIDRAFT_233447 [Lottia gigantea]
MSGRLNTRILQENLQTELSCVVVALSTLFILGLQIGYSLLEAGISRSRNVYTIITRNTLLLFEVCILYWVTGHALAFSSGNMVLGYQDFWFGMRLNRGDYSQWLFGFCMCLTSTNIIATSLVERVRFEIFFLITFMSVGFVQPVVLHWMWHEEGWLKDSTTYVYQDFSGVSCVNIYSGVVGIIGCILLKPRINRFQSDPYSRAPKPFHGHSKPLIFMGGYLILSGLLALRILAGYQSGSVQRFDEVAVGLINTLIATSACVLTSIAILTMLNYCGTYCCKVGDRHDWFLLLTAINSALSGVVSSGAGCDVYYPWAAGVTGFISGCVYIIWCFLLRSCQIDDPLEVGSVHLGSGIWSLISAPLFSTSGFIYSPGTNQLMVLAWNLAGIGAIMLWTGLPFIVLFISLRLCGIFRVSQHLEVQGLDEYHQEVAYNIKLYNHSDQIQTNTKTNDLSSLNSWQQYESTRSTIKHRPSLKSNMASTLPRKSSIRRHSHPYAIKPTAPSGSMRDNSNWSWLDRPSLRRSREISASFGKADIRRYSSARRSFDHGMRLAAPPGSTRDNSKWNWLDQPSLRHSRERSASFGKAGILRSSSGRRSFDQGIASSARRESIHDSSRKILSNPATWWTDPTTGRKFYSQRPVEWGSMPNINQS